MDVLMSRSPWMGESDNICKINIFEPFCNAVWRHLRLFQWPSETMLMVYFGISITRSSSPTTA